MKDTYTGFVNLHHRTDRLAHMTAQLEKEGIKAVRHRGLLPSEVDIHAEKEVVLQRRTPGACGCHYSQVGIMQAALSQDKHAFVMEDDLIFCEDFQKRLAYIEEWMELCNVQGIIFHDAKTCPYNTNSRFAMPARLHEKLGIPTLVINGDLNDLRFFSEEQTKTNIEAFVEQLSEVTM